MSGITARSAGTMIRGWLERRHVAGVVVKARTVSFSDLARGSAVFVHIENGETLSQAEWQYIFMLATNNGFFIC